MKVRARVRERIRAKVKARVRSNESADNLCMYVRGEGLV